VRKKAGFMIFAVLAALVLPALTSPSKLTADKTSLPERYKKWLDEEVVYIISSLEREVFLKLQADRERDLFIEAFWKHRDPTPNSADNEFKTEHYRRINYANRFLGREAPKPGWMTNRGRIYIILGEPNDIQRLQGEQGIYNCEIWFYQGKTDLGLPPGFNILFYQENNQGEYRLYSPTNDGPQALLAGEIVSVSDYAAAYKKLVNINPTLASVSMSLVPGEQSGIYGRPSLISDMMIQKIESAPERMVEEKYARKFLEYKDLVEVEYTANYLDSDSMVKVLKDPAGNYFVHYIIEPKKLSVNNYENKYYTTLKLNGNVTTLEGKPVYQYDKTIALEMNEAEMRERSNLPFAIHDMFPLTPGDYKLLVLVKNEVSKEFTSVEQTLHIPAEATTLQMTSPILAYKVSLVDPPTKKLKPFRMGSHQIYSQPGRVFLPKDTLSVAFQLLGLEEDLKRKGEVRFAFFKDEQLFKEKTRQADEYAELPTIIEDFSLSEFPPAHYRVQVSFLADRVEAVTAKDEFDITFQAAIPRPWVYSRILPEAGDPLYAQVIGLQLYNLGRLDEARLSLEKAFRVRPDSQEIAVQLAQIDLSLKRFDMVETLLAPFLAEEKTPRYEIFNLTGRAAMGAGKLERAIEIFDESISHYGVNVNVLNAIGDCYFGLGKFDEARAVWEKSLTLSPEQPDVKKRLETLKNRRTS
jgi:GWxTD domain-containing protein